jgi:stage V sporulation protein B
VLFSLLLSAILMALGDELGVLIYHSTEAGALITAFAPLIPLMYLDFIVDSLMTGLGQQMKTLRINTLDYVLRIGFILLLIPRYGFAAYIGIVYASTLLNATLSIRYLLTASDTRINYPLWVFGPLLAAAISALLATLLQKLLPLGSDALSVIMLSVLICFVYIALLFITRCLTGADTAFLRGVIRGAKRRSE